MELIIVVITLGVITSLALSNYNNIMEQSYCRNAQMNLIAISHATAIRATKDPQTDITTFNTAATNTNLKLAINDPRFIYTFEGLPIDYVARATRTGGPNYACRINNVPSTSLSCFGSSFCPTVLNP